MFTVLQYQLAGLWPLFWHFGLGGVIVAACVALYMFEPAGLATLFPRLHNSLLWVAALVATIMVSTAIGVSLGEKRIQAQWDVARANAVENAKKARTDAVRDVARKPSHWVRPRADNYDRDGQ